MNWKGFAAPARQLSRGAGTLRARSLPGMAGSGKKMNGDAGLEQESKPYTLKLSPQPHSPLTFGLRNRKASFSPCFTKSTSVPSM